MGDDKKVCEAKVFRFDPETQKEPEYRIYSVPYEEGNTVMDILCHIYENLDGSLAFRMGCAGAGHQRCGACPVVVNGRPRLSCKALVEGKMTIEPHPRFEVIRDLALDFDKKREDIELKPSVKITIDSEKCDGCRDCVIICPIRIYELKKSTDKVIPNVAHLTSCCGESCSQCVIFCKNSAITVEDI